MDKRVETVAAQRADPDFGAGADPLLSALEYVCGYFRRPFSATAAIHGLPLPDGRLTVGMFARSAAQLGLEARPVRRRPSTVPGLVCPFLVLFKSGDVGIVTEKTGRGRKLRVVLPGITDGRDMTAVEIDANAFDVVIYISDRSQAAAPLGAISSPSARRGHWLWGTLGRFWPSWTQVIAAALIVNLLGLALPLFVMTVYDRVIPYNSIPTLWALAAGVTIALAFDFILRMLRAQIIENSSRRIDMAVSADLFAQALDAKMALRPARAGELANQVREFESVREFFTSSSLTSAIDLLFIGVFLGLLWFLVGELALVPLMAVPIFLAATLALQIPLARSVTQSQTASAGRHATLVEALFAIETVKAQGGEGLMQRNWENAVSNTVRASHAIKFWSSLATYFSVFMQQAVSVVVIVWGVYLVSAGEITIGALIASNILSGRVLAPLSGIAMTLARAQGAFVSMRQIDRLMRIERDHGEATQYSGHIDRAAIELRDLSFSYPGQPIAALTSINLRVRPGERIGVIGRVASGKSTLGKLLGGLYEPETGSILIDGTDSRHYWMADIRRAIVYVVQEPELFSGTLRENIVFGRRIGERDFEAAARATGVAAFAASHPLGYAMPIGERGRAISGGQRQAVAISRALLGDPRVLFLDEPTSAMDSQTEANFIAGMRNWLKPETTLIVATHRGTLLQLIDRLIVFEAGKIIADGPRDKVLKELNKRRPQPRPAARTRSDG